MSAAQAQQSNRGAVSCVICGYDLRGIPPKARCPECGAPAPQAARHDLVFGAWKLLRRKQAAAFLIPASLLAFVGAKLGEWSCADSIARILHPRSLVFALIAQLFACGALYAAWRSLATSAFDGNVIRAERVARSLVLCSIWIPGVATLVTATLYLAPFPVWSNTATWEELWKGGVFYLLPPAALLLHVVVALRYLRALAARLLDDGLARWSRRAFSVSVAALGAPFVALVSVVFGPAPLITMVIAAGILYLASLSAYVALLGRVGWQLRDTR